MDMEPSMPLNDDVHIYTLTLITIYIVVVQYTSDINPSQITITTIFSLITPTNATSQSRDTQMGSQPGHNKGVTIDQAIVICRARRPRPHGSQPQHPCH